VLQEPARFFYFILLDMKADSQKIIDAIKEKKIFILLFFLLQVLFNVQ